MRINYYDTVQNFCYWLAKNFGIASNAKTEFKNKKMVKCELTLIIPKRTYVYTHYKVGKAVRETIKKLGGTMPEDLPTPTKSVKQIEKERFKDV